jgi:hypothetical protein
MDHVKNKKRAIRIAHRKRVIEKRKDYYAKWAERANNKHRVLGILAKTATVCSCASCGNPRKHFKQETLAEKRNRISYSEYD